MQLAEAEGARRFELPLRHRFECRPVDFAFVRGVVQPQAEQRRQERRQPHDRRQAVVEDEELQQHRRAAHHFHVGREHGAQPRRSVDASDGNRRAHAHGQQHGHAREHECDESRPPQRGQISQGEGPGVRPRQARTRRAGLARLSFEQRVGARQHGRVQARLVVVPHLPFAEDGLEPAVAHGGPKRGIHVVAQRRLLLGHQDDVVARRHGLGVRREPRLPAHDAVRQHVVEQHGIDPAEQQIAVGVDVVVVRHGHDTVLAFGGPEQFPGERGIQRGHPLAAQIGERAKAIAIALAHGEHFAEGVVGDAHLQLGALGGRILQAVHGEVEVAALHRLVERGKRHLHELWCAARSRGDELRDFDVEAAQDRRIVGVGLDKRGAAFGIRAPAQHRRLRRRWGHGQTAHDCGNDADAKHGTQYTARRREN